MKKISNRLQSVFIFIFVFLPVLIMAESKMPYNSDLDYYIGTWECVDNIPDAQWVPNKFEIKKKGKSVVFVFYKMSGKVPKDFYSGPYMYKGDGIFEWEALPGVLYSDIRPSQRNVFKYHFHTRHTDSGWGLRVTKWYYNDFGEIEQQIYLLNYEKK